MSLVRCLATVALALALVGPARAQVTAEGQTFPARLPLAGSELQLNGVGLRSVAWLKGYLAALYLPQKTGSAAEVLAQPGAKRLQLRMLQEAPAEEFAKAFGRGVKRNTPEAELPALEERVHRFDALVRGIGKVRKGDVVDLDFVPGRGLVFSLNGKPRGEPIAGDDFYAALLRIFIGAKPAQAELKTGLLGGPVS